MKLEVRERENIMDKDELIFNEYKLYAEQKENFINRNFRTNRFYMLAVIALLFALIYTGNVVFMQRITATLVFSLFGLAASAMWWMNVDSYNTLIKIKYGDVIEKIEDKLPVQPFKEEAKGIEEFRKNKVFMFSDIQKFIAAISAMFFFAVCISEISPLVIKMFDAIAKLKGGI